MLEARLALRQRYWSNDSDGKECILDAQRNLAGCLVALGRRDEALVLKREVYAGEPEEPEELPDSENPDSENPFLGGTFFTTENFLKMDKRIQDLIRRNFMKSDGSLKDKKDWPTSPAAAA